VLREHRGRGIARSLKLHEITLAGAVSRNHAANGMSEVAAANEALP
jgi:hypothetical protein